MRPHRLGKLTLLTQGIALVGFSAGEAACHHEANLNGPYNGPDNSVHINAPPVQDEDGAVAAPDVVPVQQADAATTAMPSNRPTMNAPPTPPPPVPTHTNAMPAPTMNVNAPPKK
jgi:hypothetical protein